MPKSFVFACLANDKICLIRVNIGHLDHIFGLFIFATRNSYFSKTAPKDIEPLAIRNDLIFFPKEDRFS